MMNRRRIVAALLALVLPAGGALAALPARADVSSTPPSCTWDDPSNNCLHDATPDTVALPAPAFTTTYNPKNHSRSITFVAAITPPHQTCPDGGVPYADIPCTFRGLSVTARLYVPGAKAAALVEGAAAAPNSPCDFTCTVTATFGSDYYGPATVILRFSVGDLIIAANDLSSTAYETTIELPADPTVGLFHPTKPTLAYSGAAKTMTLQLAGKAGVPKTGAAGMLLDIVTSSQESFIQGGEQICCDIGSLNVVPGTTLKVKKVLPGNLTVRVVGWYAKAASTTGYLLHKTLGPKRMKIAPVISLRSAGVPADATAALVVVITTTSSASVGGIPLPKRAYARYVLAPLKTGARLAVKTGKGTQVLVYGWLEPAHLVDEGFAVPTAQLTDPEELSRVFGLPDADTIY